MKQRGQELSCGTMPAQEEAFSPGREVGAWQDERGRWRTGVNDRSERRRENKRERARAEGARGTGIALRNEQPVERASASCWLLTAAAAAAAAVAAVAAVAEYGAANEAKTRDERGRRQETEREYACVR